MHGVYDRYGCRNIPELIPLSRYHSVNDKRIPQKFICFDCRARADVSWDLIKTNLYPQILSKFRQLALFRRAIKIVETTKAETPSEFGRKIGGDNILARQLFKRLETEGKPSQGILFFVATIIVLFSFA